MQRDQSISILQSELVDAKVEVSVSRAVALLAEQLTSFKQDIYQQMSAFREDVRSQISSLRTEMCEQINGLREEMHREINGLREEMHREINSLRQEMHEQINGLRDELRAEIRSLREEVHEIRFEFGNRITATEIALGIRREMQQQVRAKLVDYTFKVAWMMGSGLLSSGIFLLIYKYIS